MKITNRHDFKNKDLRENAFDIFHSEIGIKIGLTKDEVYYVRRVANAQNMPRTNDVLNIIKYSLKCRKRAIISINKELAKISSREECHFKKIILHQSISNLEEKIAWREHILAKIEPMQEAEWTFLLQGINILTPLQPDGKQ